MARYKDVEGYRKLFDEEYKKTRKLISEGETHLDNLAEGFSEASRVIDRMPTADVVPKSEWEKLQAKIDELKKDRYQILPDGRIELIPRTDVDKTKSDLAREIFGEIYEDCFDQFGYINYEALAELKKKYTEEKK